MDDEVADLFRTSAVVEEESDDTEQENVVEAVPSELPSLTTDPRLSLLPSRSSVSGQPKKRSLTKRITRAIKNHVESAVAGSLWALLVFPVGVGAGVLCAVFLYVLEKCTEVREDHPWMLFLLPIAGVVIFLVNKHLGKDAVKGMNLILDEIWEPRSAQKQRGSIPTRMAPLVLFSTWATHLFGGSAGREGTAVQMSVSFASTYAHFLRWCGVNLQKDDTRILFIASIGAGFGGVFGTPMAAAIFSLEVLKSGILSHDATIPSLVASITADWFGRYVLFKLGSSHSTYYSPCLRDNSHTCEGLISESLDADFTIVVLAQVVFASIIFGLVASLFAFGMHTWPTLLKRLLREPRYHVLMPVIGGLLVIALRYAVDSDVYLGIGVDTIKEAFYPRKVTGYAWLMKIIFTVITLGSGFKGGEVTPLFFIGACTGNVIARVLQVPDDQTNLFAALGFVATFGAATNTPIASMVMGVELFGGAHTIYIGVACFLAFVASGSHRIYSAQKSATGNKVVLSAIAKAFEKPRMSISSFRGRSASRPTLLK
eukprot:c9496_g1_i1.p1 GENE.c9496_g1_i1~~c9496_g1_i1.p1  ORF type:complete len:542 (+),score=106.90 c9496_g1_i1:40-1665(+)